MINLFGKKIRNIRIEEEMTLKEFAEKMGYSSVSYISNIERGLIIPSNDFSDKMLTVFPSYVPLKKDLEHLLQQQKKSNVVTSSLEEKTILFARKYQTSTDSQKKRIDRILNEMGL